MPPVAAPSMIRSAMLGRRGVLSIAATGPATTEAASRAFALELAELGYVASSRLQARLAECSSDDLTTLHEWVIQTLAEKIGSDKKHVPLFRDFPEGIPADTVELWYRKVIVHYLQSDDQPCLFCRRIGTTHVLNPCRHVVCDRCFDGANYSACPACEHHVDRASPFFQPSAPRGQPQEHVRFKLLDLSDDLTGETYRFFQDLCRRTQALSPDDLHALTSIVAGLGIEVLGLIPSSIPIRENVAAVFGTLLARCEADVVLPVAAKYLTTATDILRLIAVHSGTDGSLQAETIFKPRDQVDQPGRFWGRIAESLGVAKAAPPPRTILVPLRVHRFKVAKLPRRMRRALLTLMEGMPEDRLIEDMLRHRSYWVWIGEFLHPHEYARRFPAVARAFSVMRGTAPDGSPAPPFQTWYAKVERAAQVHDTSALLGLLAERPGEFARRLDHVLRLASADPTDLARIADAFVAHIDRYALPVLATLRSHLPTRLQRATRRVYWPKGAVGKGVFDTDARATLAAPIVERVVHAIESELLRRFAEKPHFEHAVIDEGLRCVVLPFNERTAARSAVNLPRGSVIPFKTGSVIRLFLHWCQPQADGQQTDLDLSVAFYDDSWKYVGVCSYYQHQAKAPDGGLIAQSSGDLRDAPWPDGATEFVDLHCGPARSAGIRFAVVVVNNYSGMPFSRLDRGFAGLMLRGDAQGTHFDPRTVELKFALQGENGIFMPMVLDLTEARLHWLDAHSTGGFELNNVETSKNAIATVCPGLMEYFASGARPSIYDIGSLHAAARCRSVTFRGSECRTFVRLPDESAQAFHQRFQSPAPDAREQMPLRLAEPTLALLFRGDLDVPESSKTYALFQERSRQTMEASDLLA